MIHVCTLGKLCFGAQTPLTGVQMHQLADGIDQRNPHCPNQVLAGRTKVATLLLEDVGRVVLKQYYRGGILRHLNQKHYLRTVKTRCQVEFEFLRDLSLLGVRVPEPVTFIRKGRIFYEAFLVTREIPQAITLAALSRSDPQKTRTLMADVIRQFESLIRHRIRHVDLHPGNILLSNATRKTYVIDFDKAVYFKGASSALALKYTARWHRAVVKYGLPRFLTEMLAEGLGIQPPFESERD